MRCLLHRVSEVDGGLEAIVRAKESFPAKLGACCRVSCRAKWRK